MKFDDFLRVRNGKYHYYMVSVYKEENFLSEEYKNLHKDIEEFKWAKNAFGDVSPNINMWLGDSRAVQSVHNDEYENIYTVITGQKIFTIFPPHNKPLLYENSFKTGFYTFENDELKLESEERKTKWCSVDILNPDLEKFPNFKYSTPYKITP